MSLQDSNIYEKKKPIYENNMIQNLNSRIDFSLEEIRKITREEDTEEETEEDTEEETEEEQMKRYNLFRNLYIIEYCVFLLTGYDGDQEMSVPDLLNFLDTKRSEINTVRINSLIDTCMQHNEVCKENMSSMENNTSSNISAKIYYMIYFVKQFLLSKYVDESLELTGKPDRDNYKLNSDFDVMINLIKNNNPTINDIMRANIKDDNIKSIMKDPNPIGEIIYESIKNNWKELKQWKQPVSGGKSRRRRRSSKKKQKSRKARRSKSKKSRQKRN